MDARTKLRLLFGPVRPFILTKLRDAITRPHKRRSAFARLADIAEPLPTLRTPVYPLPSVDDDHSYAVAMVRGQFNGFGVERWDRDRFWVDAPDPRTTIELARCHQFTAYALGAHAKHEPQIDWFAEFTYELKKFLANHPPLESPLWSVGMDTGIRLFNILVAWDWFAQCGHRSDEVDALVARTTREHEIALSATLETSGGMGTSHLLGGLLGFLAYSSYVRRPASDVRRPASGVLRQFEREVRRQILDDGMTFEASTGYHRQAVDILVQAEVLIRNTPELLTAASTSLFERITKAADALAELERAGMPLVGDNDDGVVLKGRKGEKAKGRKGSGEFIGFEKFGLWIWHLDDAVLTARNGPVGQYGKGGHAHNDQNSITLSVGGEPVIIDPGSYCYVSDPERRNIDRSTAVHATVDLGVEQAWWPEDEGEGLFWMLQEGQRPFVEVALGTRWRGHVHAHTRTIGVKERWIEVVDRVQAGSTLGNVSFPLGPNVRIEMFEDEEHCVAHLHVGGRVVKLFWTDAVAEVVPMNMAPAYMVNVPTQRLVLKMNSTAISWSLTW